MLWSTCPEHDERCNIWLILRILSFFQAQTLALRLLILHLDLNVEDDHEFDGFEEHFLLPLLKEMNVALVHVRVNDLVHLR